MSLNNLDLALIETFLDCADHIIYCHTLLDSIWSSTYIFALNSDELSVWSNRLMSLKINCLHTRLCTFVRYFFSVTSTVFLLSIWAVPQRISFIALWSQNVVSPKTHCRTRKSGVNVATSFESSLNSIHGFKSSNLCPSMWLILHFRITFGQSPTATIHQSAANVYEQCFHNQTLLQTQRVWWFV